MQELGLKPLKKTVMRSVESKVSGDVLVEVRSSSAIGRTVDGLLSRGVRPT